MMRDARQSGQRYGTMRRGGNPLFTSHISPNAGCRDVPLIRRGLRHGWRFPPAPYLFVSVVVAWLLGSGHTFLSVQDNRWQTSDHQTCDGENVTGKRPKMGYKVENDTHLSYHSDIPALEVCRRRQSTHPRTPTPGRQRYKLFCSGAEGLTHTNLLLMSLLVPVATLLSTPNTLRAGKAPHSCFRGEGLKFWTCVLPVPASMVVHATPLHCHIC